MPMHLRLPTPVGVTRGQPSARVLKLVAVALEALPQRRRKERRTGHPNPDLSAELVDPLGGDRFEAAGLVAYVKGWRLDAVAAQAISEGRQIARQDRVAPGSVIVDGTVPVLEPAADEVVVGAVT